MAELHPTLARLAQRLADRAPDTRSWKRLRREAAVAVVLRPVGDDVEVLLMRRMERAGDRWSGDIACPGGFCTPGEAPLTAAIRETREELGLSLDGAVLLGPLGPRPARPWHRFADFRVTPFVFAAPAAQPLVLEPSEVASARWVSLAALRDRSRRERFLWWWRFARPMAIPFLVPRVWVDDYDVWGLTLLILDELQGRLEA